MRAARRRREAIEELRDHGWTLQGIAERLGVTKSVVSNWVNRTKPLAAERRRG
jgi:predicted transcriptional regulator